VTTVSTGWLSIRGWFGVNYYRFTQLSIGGGLFGIIQTSSLIYFINTEKSSIQYDNFSFTVTIPQSLVIGVRYMEYVTPVPVTKRASDEWSEVVISCIQSHHNLILC